MTIIHNVSVHLQIWVMADRNGDGGVAKRAARCDSVCLERVKLGAVVLGRSKVVGTECSSAEVTANGQKVVLVACRMGARTADKQHLGIGTIFPGSHCVGRWV